MGAPTLHSIAEALAPSGFVVRGALNFGSDENGTPPGPSGLAARAAVLIGNAGGAFWEGFKVWLERQPDGLVHPLDTYSREVIGAAAGRLRARAVSPSDRPFPPFQQWAMRAEGLKPSPLGILIHPEYGLWHAWRGALLFDVALDLSALEKPIHHCDACDAKPCLNACPVDAFDEATFAYQACTGHVRSDGGTACLGGGCLARNACPYGTDYRYPADMQAWLMRAFVGAPRKGC